MSHLRRSLSAPLANGHTAFVLPCKKLVFEYCEHWASNAGLREYLVQDLRRLASRYPGVELVVRRREFKHPVVRAVYGPFFVPSLHVTSMTDTYATYSERT